MADKPPKGPVDKYGSGRRVGQGIWKSGGPKMHDPLPYVGINSADPPLQLAENDTTHPPGLDLTSSCCS